MCLYQQSICLLLPPLLSSALSVYLSAGVCSVAGCLVRGDSLLLPNAPALHILAVCALANCLFVLVTPFLRILATSFVLIYPFSLSKTTALSSSLASSTSSPPHSSSLLPPSKPSPSMHSSAASSSSSLASSLFSPPHSSAFFPPFVSLLSALQNFLFVLFSPFSRILATLRVLIPSSTSSSLLLLHIPDPQALSILPSASVLASAPPYMKGTHYPS